MKWLAQFFTNVQSNEVSFCGSNNKHNEIFMLAQYVLPESFKLFDLEYQFSFRLAISLVRICTSYIFRFGRMFAK